MSNDGNGNGNGNGKKPDLHVVVDNSLVDGVDEVEQEEVEEAQIYSTASLHGHKFSGKSLIDAVEVLDRGSREKFPANDLKDVGMKLSVLGMAEAHIKRLSRLDRAMSLIEQQIATPDRLAQMPANELAKMYRLLGASMDVSQRYVKESLWVVNIGELQEQITELMAGAGAGAGEDSDHSTREVVADIFRRVSGLGQNFPEPSDGSVPVVNPDYLPNDLLNDELRGKNEAARQASHQAMVNEAKADAKAQRDGTSAKPQKSNATDATNAPEPQGSSMAGLSGDELSEVLAEEVGESSPVDLSGSGQDSEPNGDGSDDSDGSGWDNVDSWRDLEDADAWGDDELDGKDDPLAGVKLDF